MAPIEDSTLTRWKTTGTRNTGERANRCLQFLRVAFGFRQRLAFVHAGTEVSDVSQPGVLEQTLALLHQLEHLGAARTRVRERVRAVAGNDFVRRAEVSKDFPGDQPLALRVRVNAVT